MTRVQVYLHPSDVAYMDDLATTIRIKRSQIIRDAVSAVNLRFQDILILLKHKPEKNPMMKYCGIIKSKTGVVGLNVDEIYDHV